MNNIKKIAISFCLIYALPIHSQTTIEQKYSDFLSKNIDLTFKFFSRGNSDFEYICKEPSLLLDCRKNNIDYLKDKDNVNFNITKLIKLKDEFLYEIYLDNDFYYLNAKRILNGINNTHYFLDESLYKLDYFEQEIIYLKSIINKSFDINSKKLSNNNFVLCKDRIELSSCETQEDNDIKDIKSVRVVDIYNKDKRHLIKLKLDNIDNIDKEYWIDYYIFKILIQK
jgi:hypothetical protein